MRCNSVQIRLDGLRTGELDPREERVVREHLSDCVECEDSLEDIVSLAETAPSLMGECPSTCREEIRKRLIDRYDEVEIEGITLWIAYTDDGVTMIAPTTERSFEEFAWDYEKKIGRNLCRKPVPPTLVRQFKDAMNGRGRGEARVDLSDTSEFERKVLEALLTIPKGEVRTYAWVAREAGNPRAVRAVGNTCAKNPVPFVIPCHRVVPTSGGLGGYRFGSVLKRRLLDREGVNLTVLEELDRRHARYVVSPEGDCYCYPTCRAVRDLHLDQIDFVRDEREAEERGLEACDWCRPLTAAA